MKIVACFVLAFAMGCGGGRQVGGKKLLDFGAFTIEAPNGWKKIKEQGIDSYVGRIAIDSTDTLEFDLGWYSNSLTEPDYNSVVRSVSGEKDPLDTAFTFAMDGDTLRAVAKKNHYYWDTIDGRKAKIVVPKQQGIGTTGIYIDSVWKAGSDIDKFNLFGDDLKPANQALLLQALKTLRFYK